MENVIEYFPLLMKGTGVTIAMALLSLALATVMGALGAWGRLTGGPVARSIVLAYTSLVRGVPDLVMLLLFFFGGQRLINLATNATGMERIDVSPFVSGVITIGFIYGAYLTETFRGAYLTVDTGQREAAYALGLKRFTTLRLVSLPQIIRFALPGYTNVWMVLAKSTAVVSIIGLSDLVGIASDAGRSTREPFWFYLAAFFIYLAITFVSEKLLDLVERRFERGFAHAR